MYVAPDGTLAVSADDFHLNWHGDTPQFVEIEESSADSPEYWNRSYISVGALRELLEAIDDSMEEV